MRWPFYLMVVNSAAGVRLRQQERSGAQTEDVAASCTGLYIYFVTISVVRFMTVCACAAILANIPE